MKERNATDPWIPQRQPVAIFRLARRRARLHGTILAAEAALMFGGTAPASAWQIYPFSSCVNLAFCVDLPTSNWLWNGPAGGPDSPTDAFNANGNWQTVAPDGWLSSVDGYPNDPNAVVVFSTGISAELDQTPLQAYSWTLIYEPGLTFMIGGSVEFSEGGGIFSSSFTMNLDQIQISGAGGVYLFPAGLIQQEIPYAWNAPRKYELSIYGTQNDYTGPTEITGATLYAYSGGAIGDQSPVTIDDTPAIAGVTRFQTGMLVVEQSETIGSLAGVGEVGLKGSLTTGGNGLSTTYAGLISGNGSLTKTGTGTFTLTGANTYTGGTEVSGGTLVGSATSIPGAIANGATVVFDQAADASFGGNIAGLNGVAGQMVKQGAGALTLTGTSVLRWTVSAGGLVSASDRFSGDLELAAGVSFTFDQTYAGTYAGEITGAGDVAFAGGGVVTLTGESTTHSGTSTVSGSLSVNGTHAGQVAVASGGTLSGNGTTGNITVASGGTIAPGNSIGTLAVNSDLTFATGSTFRVEVDGDSGADRIDVAGTATLKGADIDLVLDPSKSYRDGGRYEILTAGSVAGRFAPVELASAFLSPGLDYGATGVTLSLSPAAVPGEPLFATVAATPNQHAAATALDGLGQTDGSEALALYNAILFSNAPDARAAFDQLSGEIHASVATGLIEDSRHVRDAMADRLAGAFATPESAASTSGPGESHPDDGTARLGTSGIEAWMSAYGSWGESDGDGNAGALKRDAGGLLVGADGFVSDTARLGLVAGYGSTSLDLAGRAASAEIDSYHVGIYGGAGLGRIDLKAGMAYSFDEIDTARSIDLGGFGDALSASAEAGTAQVFGEVSTRFDLGATRLDPFANLAYVSVDTDAHGEASGAASLAVLGNTSEATFSTFGLRAETALPLGPLGLTAKAMLGWRHAYGDTTPEAALLFAGGATFEVDGAPIAEDAAVVDLGLSLAIAPQASLSLHYDGQFATDARDNGVTARLGIAF